MQPFPMFDEVQFPPKIAFNSMAGPNRSTNLIIVGSGAERRNARWANSRRSYSISYLHSLDDVHAVIEFWECRNGRLIGFRFKDWTDFKSCPPQQIPKATDQFIGDGTGTVTSYQLTKTYQSGPRSYVNNIYKPVENTVILAINGVITNALDIDYESGLVSGTVPVGQRLTAGYEFDRPVRFDSDKLEIALSDNLANTAQNIPMMELPSP